MHVNEFCQTDMPGVYHDRRHRARLDAHKAMEEGVMVAEGTPPGARRSSTTTASSLVYLHAPEIAWVRANEQQLKAAGTPFNVGIFPFAANGRALAANDSAGMVKLLTETRTGRVLGTLRHRRQRRRLVQPTIVWSSVPVPDLALYRLQPSRLHLTWRACTGRRWRLRGRHSPVPLTRKPRK